MRADSNNGVTSLEYHDIGSAVGAAVLDVPDKEHSCRGNRLCEKTFIGIAPIEAGTINGK